MKARVLIWFWVSVLAAVGLIQPTSAQEEVTYVKLGGELVLVPNISAVVNPPLKGILWKHGANKVTEWDNKFSPDVDYYGTYKNRTELNKETAKLVVRNLQERDNGVYSVELNGRGQSTTFKTKFIVGVPKPEVILKPLTCSLEHSTQCALVCDGGEPTETTGPFTYRWMKIVDDKLESMDDTNQTLTIVKDEATKKIQKFACELSNPVSALKSDQSDNKFYVPPDSSVGIIILVIILLLILVLVLVCLLGVKLSEDFRNMLPGPVSECLKKCLHIQDVKPTDVKPVPTEDPDKKNEEVPLGDRADKDGDPTAVVTDDSAKKENGAQKEEVTYVKLKGELVLVPDISAVDSLPLRSILWKHGANKVTEWDGDKVDYYGTYKNRTDLNKETAKLVVRNLLQRDDGVYSVELNGRGQSTTFKTKFIETEDKHAGSGDMESGGASAEPPADSPSAAPGS